MKFKNKGSEIVAQVRETPGGVQQAGSGAIDKSLGKLRIFCNISTNNVMWRSMKNVTNPFRTLYKVKDDIPKVPQTNPLEKKKNRCLKEKETQKSSCSTTRNSAFKEALNDALKITKGWTRKRVQRRNGQSAGQWDVYLFR